ncbi:hypothetical protein KY334_04315, partial [Candidatus Woesearchaeota archaeon]|nr:hypothetical protein [Candidatus Woesearchaeota archaeon]
SSYTFINKLPTIVDKYGDLTQYEDDQGIQSCSMRESIELQGMFTNDSISVAAAIMLEDLLIHHLIDYQGRIINLTADKAKLYL